MTPTDHLLFRLAKKSAMASIMFALCASAYANDGVPAEKFITDYERGRTSDGEPIVTQSRSPLWEDPATVGQEPDVEAIGGYSKERGWLDAARDSPAVEIGSLKTMFERLNENERYIELYNQVSGSGSSRNDPNYGHEGDLSDLEERAGELENTLIPDQQSEPE